MGSLVERIESLHGESVLRKSALRIRRGAEIFEKILSGAGYRTVVEIGTFRGCSAAVLSRYCDKVVTLDLKHGQLEQHNTPFDRISFWRSLGIDNIELRLIEDDTEKAELLGSLDFDFAFVDGAHDETVKDDFELVKKCGHVLFHDYDDRGQPCLNHVYDFVNSLPKEQVEIFDIFALWTGK